jgi:DNA-binding PadR family transcriptional regulator
MMSASQGARSPASIRSPLYWSLLGLLIERPGYGYELIQRFEREFGEALPLNVGGSHIYEGLSVLQAASLIEEYTPEGRRKPTARRQPTPYYRSTPQGICAYADWLKERVRAERLRPRLFARQLAVLESAPQLGLEVVERFEQACIEDARSTSSGPPPGGIDSLAQALPAEQARLASEAELPWASYARARFAALAKATVDADGAA